MEKAVDATSPLRNFFINNPLATVWYKPRATIRELIIISPEKYVILFAVLSGIYRTLSLTINRGFSEQFPLSQIIMVGVIGGAILGIISLYITGIALHFVGMTLGGEGEPEHIRTVIAWSSIPDSILLLLTLPLVLLGASHWLINSPGVRETVFGIFSLTLLPITILFLILRTIIFIVGLMEVYEFPLWKTIITVVIGYIVMLIPFFCLFGMLISI